MYNFGVLPSGTQRIKVYADGYLFAEHSFSTIQLSAGQFVRGKSAEVRVDDFPIPGSSVLLRWEQSLQNFVIVEETLAP